MQYDNRPNAKLSKADRLKWKPLKELKPVKFNEETVRGKKVDPKDLAPFKGGNKTNLLIP